MKWRAGGMIVASMPLRKIVHVDMDAFYASVEQRDDPSLKGRCVIVGGLPGTRGVVCAASYEARKSGVHSAMSANLAYRLCPKAVFLKPRFDAYQAVSQQIRAIFLDYTGLVEPLSLDEAYLDVTANRKGIPYATRIAKEIKRRIKAETGGLTASAGVSYNKFLAKVASDVKKPDGLTVIRPEDADAFLETLPIGRFYGVGDVTERLMLEKGVKTGADLRRLSKLELAALFGSSAEFYYEIARGIDGRPVCPDRVRKSLGTETTFQTDIDDVPEMAATLRQQAEEISADLRRRKLKGRTITLKVKFFDFRSIARSLSLEEPVDDARTIADTAIELLSKTEAGEVKVRLIGVTVSKFPETEAKGSAVQLEFDFGGQSR